MSRHLAPMAFCCLLATLLLINGCTKKDRSRGSKRTAPATAKERRAVKKKSPSGATLAAEKEPHPDFPTPRLARTDKIFLLEEPERGPLVITAATPDLAGLRWTTHQHCELAHDGLACGPAGKGGPRVHWRVGRRGQRTQVVERRFGRRVEQTYLLSWGAAGLQRMVALDRRGAVRWSRHLDLAGKRYSSRKLSGGNALLGCGYISLERDARGRVVLAGCLQWNGRPMKDKNGVVFIRFARDRNGLVSRQQNLDARRKPVDGQDGVHSITYKRDRAGRDVEQRFADTQGFPTLSSRSGCHGWRWRYNAQGRLASEICLDAAGKPAVDNKGVCRYELSYNGRGCKVGVVNLERSSGGGCDRPFKRYTYQVSDRCERLVKVCQGAKPGKRKSCGVGQPAEYRYARDGMGRVISRKHLSANRQPAKDPHCAAFEVRFEYDERGNTVLETYHGASGQPVQCSKTGYHGIKSTVDDAGRTTQTHFIDVRGRPATNMGCAVRRFDYDNYDHQIKATNYDARGKLYNVRGMAIRAAIYDQGHRRFGLLLYDAQQRPASYRACFTGVRCPGKAWHAVRIMRNPQGKVTTNLYFDRDGQLIHTLNCDKQRCWL